MSLRTRGTRKEREGKRKRKEKEINMNFSKGIEKNSSPPGEKAGKGGTHKNIFSKTTVFPKAGPGNAGPTK